MSKNTGKSTTAKKVAKSIKKLSARELVLLAICVILAIALVVTLVIGSGSLKNFFKGDPSEPEQVTQIVESRAYIEKQSFSAIGSTNMQVHFIDVGQGDAILVRFPDGKDMIVDAGSGTSENSTVRNDYLDYLESIQLDAVDYMIVTHDHTDHMNFLDNVLDEYVVKNVYYNGYNGSPNTATYGKLIDKINAEDGVQAIAFDGDGDTYEINGSGYSVKIYAPGYMRFSDDRNYMSPFVTLEYAGRKVLLTGDAEEESETWFLDTLGDELLDVDVLKVGHHGSEKGTCTRFLDEIKPEFAVICVGDGNDYDHPTPATMNDLFDYGIVTYRTDRHGNIVLYVDNEGDFGFLPEKAVITENNSKGVDEHYLKAA